MLEPAEFEEKYSDAELESELPDRPLTSLRDIQYLYGRLYTLATAGGGEYAAFLTPDQARDLFEEPESLIALRVDLRGDEPTLSTDGSGPVRVTTYRSDLVEKVAHCKYEAARGIDHSITHRSGRDNDPEKLARYVAERLTKWPTDEVVQAVAESHDRGWIIDWLAELGEDESVLEEIERAVDRELGGPTTALITVTVTLDDEDELWPGEIDVFQEAMKRRKLSKLVAKNAATDSSGRATDIVSGEVGQTVGMAEDPLNYFLGKQQETFPGLNADDAWRSHPLSEDAAVTVMNAGTFVDACTFPAFGATVYYLPYFLGRITPEEARTLYDLLYGAVDEDEMTPIGYTYETFTADEIREQDKRMRFYVAAIMKHQMSRYDVYGETLNGRLLVPWEVGINHETVLGSWLFSETHERNETRSPPMPSHEDWGLLSDDGDFRKFVASGGYLYGTLPDADDDSDASVDDLRIQALIASLGGEPVSVEALIGGYVDRLVDDDGERFPSLLVASQFAQLTALSNTPNVLEAETAAGRSIIQPHQAIESMDKPETQAVTDGGSTYVQNRHEKIEQFIKETPALQHSQRRGAFLLGALVGAVGNYQTYREERSTTLVDQYPVDSMTTKRVKKITQEAIAKTLTYTRQEQRGTTLFEWIVDRLRDTILDPDPEEWELDTNDLRFYYALGVTYGMNDYDTDSE